MRKVLKASIVLAMLLMLSAPAQAWPNEDGSWRGTRERIVKFLQKLRGAVASFGDGMTDPRP